MTDSGVLYEQKLSKVKLIVRGLIHAYHSFLWYLHCGGRNYITGTIINTDPMKVEEIALREANIIKPSEIVSGWIVTYHFPWLGDVNDPLSWITVRGRRTSKILCRCHAKTTKVSANVMPFRRAA